MTNTGNLNENPVYVSLEFTPNPNTLKYSVNRVLLEKGTLNILKSEDAVQKSPLAVRLFSIQGISGVMIGSDFVTVTKSDEGDWDRVHQGASGTIEEYLNEGAPVLTDEALAGMGVSSNKPLTEVEKKIVEILEYEIRPAVAMDGGDITFDRFEDGVVYLQLQGSCAGCPSSTATLKQGIEVRLKEFIPEVQEVVSV